VPDPPEAVALMAEVWPWSMVEGLAELVTESGGLTVTVADAVAEVPSESMTSMQNVVVAVNGGVTYEAEVPAGEPEQLGP
jgi:hypothetical protein